MKDAYEMSALSTMILHPLMLTHFLYRKSLFRIWMKDGLEEVYQRWAEDTERAGQVLANKVFALMNRFTLSLVQVFGDQVRERQLQLLTEELTFGGRPILIRFHGRTKLPQNEESIARRGFQRIVPRPTSDDTFPEDDATGPEVS